MIFFKALHFQLVPELHWDLGSSRILVTWTLVLLFHPFQYSLLLTKQLGHIRLFATPWTVAHQVPRSMGFPSENTGVGFHFLLQGISTTQGSNLGLLNWRQILYHFSHQGRPTFNSFSPFTVNVITDISLIHRWYNTSHIQSTDTLGFKFIMFTICFLIVLLVLFTFLLIFFLEWLQSFFVFYFFIFFLLV